MNLRFEGLLEELDKDGRAEKNERTYIALLLSELLSRTARHTVYSLEKHHLWH